MKKLILACSLLGLMVACHLTTPEDEVREARHKYKLTLKDFIISEESNELTYEIEVQNQSGGAKLQELTLITSAYDKDMKVIWSKQFEFDVTGLGDFATKTTAFKEVLEIAPQIDSLQVILAPDLEGEEYKNYREFKRIVR